MQQITPHLWFNDQAEEAATFYTNIFKNSKVVATSYYTADTPTGMPKGSVLAISFDLNGQRFTALNGGPIFTFNEAISFIVECEDQDEIDYFWEKLSAVPEAEQCGWLKDKYGVSWQIVPKDIAKLMADPDQVRSGRVMEALLKMKKLDLAKLQEAHGQE